MEELYNEFKPFWIAHNESCVFHYGELKQGQVIATGQPFLEFFKSEYLQQARLTELGYEIPNI